MWWTTILSQPPMTQRQWPKKNHRIAIHAADREPNDPRNEEAVVAKAAIGQKAVFLEVVGLTATGAKRVKPTAPDVKRNPRVAGVVTNANARPIMPQLALHSILGLHGDQTGGHIGLRSGALEIHVVSVIFE